MRLTAINSIPKNIYVNPSPKRLQPPSFRAKEDQKSNNESEFGFSQAALMLLIPVISAAVLMPFVNPPEEDSQAESSYIEDVGYVYDDVNDLYFLPNNDEFEPLQAMQPKIGSENIYIAGDFHGIDILDYISYDNFEGNIISLRQALQDSILKEILQDDTQTYENIWSDYVSYAQGAWLEGYEPVSVDYYMNWRIENADDDEDITPYENLYAISGLLKDMNNLPERLSYLSYTIDDDNYIATIKDSDYLKSAAASVIKQEISNNPKLSADLKKAPYELFNYNLTGAMADKEMLDFQLVNAE